MLLAIDVGNTNITFGVFEGAALVHHFRSESVRTRTGDEHIVLVRQLLALGGIEPGAVRAAIVASVVPALTDVMIDLVRRGFAREPIVVGPGVRTGMPVLYENPHEVGADRIVNAVAAYDQVKGGAIVVDFGTATIFDCITPKGEYLGGCIAPGVQISAEALFARASKLHRVDLAPPPRVVGRNSAHSMQSGIVFGFAGLVDGLVARLREELGFPCVVLATGGLAPLIAGYARTIERVDEGLTLTGLRLLYERNRSGH
jgi:type III pantothenate kinase